MPPECSRRLSACAWSAAERTGARCAAAPRRGHFAATRNQSGGRAPVAARLHADARRMVVAIGAEIGACGRLCALLRRLPRRRQMVLSRSATVASLLHPRISAGWNKFHMFQGGVSRFGGITGDLGTHHRVWAPNSPNGQRLGAAEATHSPFR